MIDRAYLLKPRTTTISLADGETATIRIVSGAVREKIITSKKDVDDSSILMATPLVYMLCDAEGALLFKEDEANLLANECPAGILDKLFVEALRANGMGKTAEDDTKKNSTTPEPSAGSTSPAISA